MHSSRNYKKLVVITSRFPFPLEKGDKLRAYYQIKELSNYFEIHLIATSEQFVTAEQRKEIEHFCESVNVHRINPLEKWIGAGINLFRKQPLQIGYFFHSRIHRKISKELRLIKPDHIYCQLIRSAEYVKHYHDCPKTIDYMDALSKGVERRADKAKGFMRILLQHEFKRLMRYENAIFEYFEHHTIISAQDRNYIFHKNRDSIKVIPNGVNEVYIQYKVDENKTIDLLFTGNMSYPPNITASKYLAKEILPRLSTKIGLTLAGANPSKEVEQLKSEHINVTGFVPDLKATYAQSKLFVAPMFLGTGLQNKLLEAMAIGIPCITTTMANNALGATPDESILIADTADDFIRQIERVLTDKNLANQLSIHGKEFIRQNYQWDKVTKELIELIGV